MKADSRALHPPDGVRGGGGVPEVQTAFVTSLERNCLQGAAAGRAILEFTSYLERVMTEFR